MREQSTGLWVLCGVLYVTACSALSHTDVSDLSAAAGALPDVSALLNARPAITTSFDDVDHTVVLPDTFGTDAHYASLTELPRSADGSVTLAPGFFELTVRSYCLHAGTAGPSRGDGYLYAPLKGPRATMIEHILTQTYAERSIPQSDVQSLIWAIEAHARPADLALPVQTAARRLLTVAELAQLQAEALAVSESDVLDRATAHLSAPVRDALVTENQVRAKLVDASTSFAELERVAVRPPLEPSASSVPAGRWSRHPGGYYVRYRPSSYTSVLVQLYIPKASVTHNGSGDIAEPASVTMVGDVAVPANTGSQRLGVSNVPSGSPPPPPIGPPPPPPNCNKKSADYANLNYGVPDGTIDPSPHKGPAYDIYSGGKAAAARDEPVFLSLKPSIDMGTINGKGGSGIDGTGDAQLSDAKIFTEPWKPKLDSNGKPDDQWGDVVSVDAHYSYTRADGSTGILTFYIEYLHLISKAFPALDSLGTPIPGVTCEGFGPDVKNGKKLSSADVAGRPLIGFEGATQGPHLHVQARLADGSVGGFMKGPLIDPTLVLYGDH